MLGAHFRDELLAEEQATGLALLVSGVGWTVDDPERGLDPLPPGLSQAQNDAILRVAAAHVYRQTGLPNGSAFLRAVQTDVFGNDLDRIDTVWKLCPVWWPAAKEENWTLVQAYTIRALQRGHITQAEYDAIKAAAIAHHIPVEL